MPHPALFVALKADPSVKTRVMLSGYVSSVSRVVVLRMIGLLSLLTVGSVRCLQSKKPQLMLRLLKEEGYLASVIK